MRVVLEARALSASMGIKTYVQELLQYLPRESDIDLTVLYDQQLTKSLPSAYTEVVVPLRHKWLLNWWLSRQVPRVLQRLQPDVVHFTKAAVPQKVQWPTVVTIYDIIPLLFPEGQTYTARRYWSHALEHAAQASDHILTTSERSKNDMAERFQLDPAKITVTPLAANLDHFYPRDRAAARNLLATKYQLKEPFILYIGTIEPRKNIPTLARAFSQLISEMPHTLVIVGKEGPGASGIKAEIAATLPADRVQYLGHVSYDDLPLLYSAADLFVWPSIYEGWGLPPQEAMACGTRVIVSDGGSLPEVVGQAGVVIPFATKQISGRLHDEIFTRRLAAEMLQALQQTEKQLQDQITLGLHHVRQFKWQTVAQTTAAVYHQVYESRATH